MCSTTIEQKKDRVALSTLLLFLKSSQHSATTRSQTGFPLRILLNDFFFVVCLFYPPCHIFGATAQQDENNSRNCRCTKNDCKEVIFFVKDASAMVQPFPCESGVPAVVRLHHYLRPRLQEYYYLATIIISWLEKGSSYLLY
jgi:hypothetical protein